MLNIVYPSFKIGKKIEAI